MDSKISSLICKTEATKQQITCPAQLKIDTQFSAFQLFAIESIINSTQIPTAINLFPHNRETNEWLNHTIIGSAEKTSSSSSSSLSSVQFLIANKIEANQAGIQVDDMECFKKLIKTLINSSIEAEAAKSTTSTKKSKTISVVENASIVNDSNKKKNIAVICDILIVS